MWPKVLIGCGAVLMLLCALGVVVTLVLMATGGGKISGDEALPAILGFAGGIPCCGGPFLLAGVIWLIKERKKRQAGSEPQA